MREENSAGGVVFYRGRVLLLRKKRGYWVLPKGHIEENEDSQMAALREVREEAGAEAEISDYIGEIKYSYRNRWTQHEWVLKRVFWFVMKTGSGFCRPQREEGFSGARFVVGSDAVRMLRYDDERKILIRALEIDRMQSETVAQEFR